MLNASDVSLLMDMVVQVAWVRVQGLGVRARGLGARILRVQGPE